MQKTTAAHVLLRTRAVYVLYSYYLSETILTGKRVFNRTARASGIVLRGPAAAEQLKRIIYPSVLILYYYALHTIIIYALSLPLCNRRYWLFHSFRASIYALSGGGTTLYTLRSNRARTRPRCHRQRWVQTFFPRSFCSATIRYGWDFDYLINH